MENKSDWLKILINLGTSLANYSRYSLVAATRRLQRRIIMKISGAVTSLLGLLFLMLGITFLIDAAAGNIWLGFVLVGGGVILIGIFLTRA